MKILLVMADLTRSSGPAEVAATALAKEMSRRGHAVAVYSDAQPDQGVQVELGQAVHHIKIPFNSQGDVEPVIKALGEFNPDVAFLFYADARLVAYFAVLQRLGCPIGVQECSSPVDTVLSIANNVVIGDVYAAFAVREAVLAEANAIRFTSPGFARSVPTHLAARVHAFFDPFDLRPSRLDHKVAEGRKRIVCGDRLTRANDDALALARAFALVADRHPDWDLVFLDSDRNREIGRFASQRGLRARIIWCDGAQSGADAYDGAMINVTCSNSNDSPVAACAAMCRGLPSIGMEGGRGASELVTWGVNGLLVPRDHSGEAMAKALNRLIEDVNFRNRLGAAAYRDAKQLFGDSCVYDRWEALFDALNSIAAHQPGGSRTQWSKANG